MSHLRVPFALGPFGPWPPEPQCPASRQTRAMAAVRPVRWSRSPEQQRNPNAGPRRVQGDPGDQPLCRLCAPVPGTSTCRGERANPPDHAAGEQPSKGGHSDAIRELSRDPNQGHRCLPRGSDGQVDRRIVDLPGGKVNESRHGAATQGRRAPPRSMGKRNRDRKAVAGVATPSPSGFRHSMARRHVMIRRSSGQYNARVWRPAGLR
jgi:hypothetical protein